MEEPQGKMSTDRTPAPNEIKMDVMEDEVAPIANASESENRTE